MRSGQFTIKPSVTEKLLGGHIHESLQWNHHLSDHKNSLISQLTSRINGLKKVASTATFQTKLMVANGVIMSKLSIAVNSLGRSSKLLDTQTSGTAANCS